MPNQWIGESNIESGCSVNLESERTVCVSKQFYAQLMEYLEVDERWVDDDHFLILYSAYGKRLRFKHA